MQQAPQVERKLASFSVQNDARLALGFHSLAASTFCLIVLGALVRAHDAGLACPDWPLCFGNWIPEIDLQVGFEWSHRLLAGCVTVAFALLAWFAWRSGARTRYVTHLLIATAGLIAIQIALGAFTVWLKLAPWTVTAHLITGNLFLSTTFLLGLAFGSAKEAHNARPPVSRSRRVCITAICALLLVQLGLGGLVSSQYAGLACPEWPTCNGGVWFPVWTGSVGLHLLHRMTAYALILLLGAAALGCRSDERLRGPTALACALAIAQACVGVASVLNGIPVEITALHTGLAAALVLTLVRALQHAWSTREASEARAATR